MRGIILIQVIIYYCATIYYEFDSYYNSSGGWFKFDLKPMITLLVANTFVIIYLQLGRSK